jgi:hypothetical protein
MQNSDISLTAKVTELDSKLAFALERLARAEGAIEQLNKSIASGNRMTNWQFIGFVIVMAGTLLGTLYWVTGVLERRIDENAKMLNAQIELVKQNVEQVKQSVEQSEKNMDARFEDLKQVVLSRKK